MGYFVPYCLACGGPCDGDDNLDDLVEEAESRNERTRLKKLISALNRLRDRRWLSRWTVVCRQGVYRGGLDGDYPAGMDDEDFEAVGAATKPVAELGEHEFEGGMARPWMTGGSVYGFHTACYDVIGRPAWDALQALRLARRHSNTVEDESVYVFNGRMGQDFEWEGLRPDEVKWLENPLRDPACAQHVRDTWQRVQQQQQKKKQKKQKKVAAPVAAASPLLEVVGGAPGADAAQVGAQPSVGH